MNKKIIESSQIPENVRVYFGKDNFASSGYRMVYPYKDEGGNVLWKNIFYSGSQNLFWIIFIVLLTIVFFYVYSHDTTEMRKVVSNPCEYCLERNTYLVEYSRPNLSGLQIQPSERIIILVNSTNISNG